MAYEYSGHRPLRQQKVVIGMVANTDIIIIVRYI